MKTFDLANNDIYLNGSQIAMIEDGDEVGQTIRTKVSTFAGEYFYNKDYGVPYWESFSNQTNIEALNITLKRVIDSTDGVDKIVDFQSSVDEAARVYKIKATINTTYNDVVSVNQNYEY